MKTGGGGGGRKFGMDHKKRGFEVEFCWSSMKRKHTANALRGTSPRITYFILYKFIDPSLTFIYLLILFRKVAGSIPDGIIGIFH
jgi:hypothetical protein